MEIKTEKITHISWDEVTVKVDEETFIFRRHNNGKWEAISIDWFADQKYIKITDEDLEKSYNDHVNKTPRRP
jgi:hypothetical protein